MYRFQFGRLVLPVTPSKLTVKIKGNNKTLTLVNEGEMNILRAPGLTEISFEAVLPMLGKYPFSGDYHRPDHYLNAFEKLMVEKQPFQFSVIRTTPSGKELFDTDMKVSLESYTIAEDANQGLDVTVAITLKQYVSYVTKKDALLEVSADGEATIIEETKRDANSAPQTKTYTVKKGDCLWTIAKKYYNDGAKYKDIYEANKDKLKSPNLIYPGQELILP
ncbi:MAG: LysM peptidoglycan-binding domain-containing protein [Peptococcaceae bacterium]|jgi:LysM repeat protein|nr:LysM peptidoglycan-binding domain-containing protein [Peptococcaceae bacterium]